MPRLTLKPTHLANLCAGVLAFGFSFGVSFSANAKQTCPAEVLSAPIYWDAGQLSAVKSQLADSGSSYGVAYKQLISDADAALTKPLYTVTDKERAGPSGDKRDYVSLSRYWWPDPNKDGGLPYVRKDGRSNPEINGVNFDRRRSQHMTDDVTALSLAAYFTGNTAYADKAKLMVDAWFLDETTGMLPHLKFAQNVPGRTEGREFGILDTRIYWDVMDSMLLLQSEGMAEPAFVNELRGWFGNYAAWLITSDFGKKAKTKKNNHGVYYDAQLAHTLIFAGRCDLAKKTIKSGYGRTKVQIHKTGLLPAEKTRTQSLFYHAFNLRAFMRLSYYGRKLDAGFYDKSKGGAGSVKDSVEFVADYAGRIDEWPYEEINKNIEKHLWTMLKNAQLLDDSQSVRDGLKALSYEEAKNRDNLILGGQ